MKQATRRLLNMRPGATVIPKVEYRPHPDSKANFCYDNAMAEQRRSKQTMNGSENRIVSGWVVGDYFKDLDSTAVMFHFWNQDSNGVDYDTTPGVAGDSIQQFEFVDDSDVYFKSFEYSMEALDGEVHFPPALKIRSRSVNMCVREPEIGAPSKDFTWIDLQEGPIKIEQMLKIRQMCVGDAVMEF